MGKLRHIAFISAEPKKLSDFYQKYFGFEECKIFPSGSRMVIDPLFNLAFLQSRGDQAGAVVGTHRADGAELERQPGIHHYGFLVDDLNEAVARLPASVNRGASPQVSAGVGGPEGARPAEMRFIDPWGNNVDLSARGFLGREEKKLPGVRLLAVQVPDLAAACEFYQQQFDLKLVGWQKAVAGWGRRRFGGRQWPDSIHRPGRKSGCRVRRCVELSQSNVPGKLRALPSPNCGVPSASAGYLAISHCKLR